MIKTDEKKGGNFVWVGVEKWKKTQEFEVTMEG